MRLSGNLCKVSSVGNITWKGAFRFADSVAKAQVLNVERYISSVNACPHMHVETEAILQEKHALIAFKLFTS